MISILVWLLIFALVCYLVYYIIGVMPLPPPVKQIVLVVFGVLAIIILLEHFVHFSGGYAP
jgi:uncharacterized membrane protein (DUF373 family)